MPNEEQAANTAFIAPARTDLPDALDLIAEKDRELTTARARIAGLEAEAGRLRVAAGAYVAALTAVEDGPEGTSDDEFRQQAARVEAGWKALRAALEGKP